MAKYRVSNRGSRGQKVLKSEVAVYRDEDCRIEAGSGG